MSILSSEEINRYKHQLILDEFGFEAQEKLKNASVLVIGAGGLGCPVLQYLCAAGIGNIHIIDDDVVEESNLPRQILYKTADIGKKKAEIAGDHLTSQNQHLNIVSYTHRFTLTNASALITPCDIVVDCSDNFETRYLVNDICKELNKTFVFAALHKFDYQVAVFGPDINGQNAFVSYRDLFPTIPPENCITNCNESGVLGIVAGMAGLRQAMETIKLITGKGENLMGKLLNHNCLNGKEYIIPIKPLKTQKTFQTIPKSKSGSQDLEAKEVQRILENHHTDYLLVDVRDILEHIIFNIGGKNIPLTILQEKIDFFEAGKKYIFYCQSGIRSKDAISKISELKTGLDLYNLKGGLNAYKKLA